MDADVAVIGAGPYGLSTAAHLRQRGPSVRVFGPPMDTWRNWMPAGMLLKSDGFASNLSAPVGGWTLKEYCRRENLPYSDRDVPRVVLERFVDYGRAFQRHFVPDLDTRLVTRLAQATAGFTLELDDGAAFTAGQVVVAVGITRFAYVPPELRGLGSQVTHSGEHRTFGAFAGKRVAVVGAGSSAIEVAAGLLEAGAEVHLLARRASVPFWGAPDPDAPGRPHALWQRLRHPSSGLGPGLRNRACQDLPDVFRHLPADRRLRLVREHLGPVSPWWLRDTVMNVADVRTSTRVTAARVDGDAVAVTTEAASGGSTVLRVDHVICGTGYVADIDRLNFLDPALRQSLSRVGTTPALSHHFESSVPGLHFAGAVAATTFGPLLRFVVGVEFAAPRLSSRMAIPAGRRRSAAAA